MPADLNNVYRLTARELVPTAAMLARAFQHYPLTVYFDPEAASEKELGSHYLSLVRYGLLYGEVYGTSPQLEGAAIWLPANKRRRTLWRRLRSWDFSMFSRGGSEMRARQRAFFEQSEAVHRRHAPFPHLYLQMIGVDPLHQGQGYGSVLLRAMFARLDEEHRPCYLETHEGKNVAFYEHHGFRVVEESKVPGAEITSWAMLRGGPG